MLLKCYLLICKQVSLNYEYIYDKVLNFNQNIAKYILCGCYRLKKPIVFIKFFK